MVLEEVLELEEALVLEPVRELEQELVLGRAQGLVPVRRRASQTSTTSAAPLPEVADAETLTGSAGWRPIAAPTHANRLELQRAPEVERVPGQERALELARAHRRASPTSTASAAPSPAPAGAAIPIGSVGWRRTAATTHAHKAGCSAWLVWAWSSHIGVS